MRRKQMNQLRLDGEEVEKRGQRWYEESIRPHVELEYHDKICVIDVETGAYEIDDTMLAASTRALAKHPDAALWAVRIGSDVVSSFS
jgi:hypothetical protein